MTADPLRILFLDDEEARYQWVAGHVVKDTVLRWVKTVPEAIVALQESQWDQVWLDHDLGTEPAVGRDVAKWIIQHPEVGINAILVHSVNIVSAPKMRDELLAAGRSVTWRPFSELVSRHR